MGRGERHDGRAPRARALRARRVLEGARTRARARPPAQAEEARALLEPGWATTRPRATRHEHERREQQALHADAQQRGMGLLVVGAREDGEVERGCAAARGASCGPACAIATTSANISSIASAGRTSTRSRASSAPALAKLCATPGATSTTSPGPAMRVRRPIRNRIRPASDLEALGLDRVDVRDRHGAAGAQREVEGEQRAARARRGVGEGEALARDRVLERLTRSDGSCGDSCNRERCVMDETVHGSQSRNFMRDRLRSPRWTRSPDCSTGPAHAARSCCARASIRRGRCGSRTRPR